MQISIIVASSLNNVIGRDNDMPWHLPTDLAYFKEKTLHKPLIMGRKTFEAIGRPLPDRKTIVVSRSNPDFDTGVQICKSIEEAIKIGRDSANNAEQPEIMIGGGANIYRQTIDQVDRIYFTHIQMTVEGDAFFPEIDQDLFRLVSSKNVPAGEKDSADMIFQVFDKRH